MKVIIPDFYFVEKKKKAFLSLYTVYFFPDI